jgi:hypothetical protein
LVVSVVFHYTAKLNQWHLHLALDSLAGRLFHPTRIMIDLARLLPKLLNASGSNPEMAEIATRLAWARAAGEGLRPHAIPFRLFRRTLIVLVADAIWQNQLQTMAAELVFRINQLLGSSVVDFIEFRIDPATIARARAHAWPARTVSSKARKPVPEDVLSAAAHIADPDLRRRFVRAAENCINRRATGNIDRD